MNLNRGIRLSHHAVLLAAVVGLLATGCSGSDPLGGGAGIGGDGPRGDAATTTGPDAGAAADGGGTSLAMGECPIDADRAPEVIQLILDVTGFEVIEEHPCRFTDGVRLVNFRVSGNSGMVDARQPLVDRGFQITDLDRGQDGFLAVGEIDAHAEANFGDLTLSVDMSSLDTDHSGYERLVRGLMDIAVRA